MSATSVVQVSQQINPNAYVFGRGWVSSWISNSDRDVNGVLRTNIVFAAGILPADIIVKRSGSELSLSLDGSSDQILVESYFNGDIAGSFAVKTISFADGTVWQPATVQKKVLTGTADIDIIDGYASADQLAGYGGDDRLDGAGGNDTLSGGNGNDILEGGAGGDRLNGGTGDDTLEGGNGADIYMFDKGSGQDTIVNYDDDARGTNADKVLLGAGITPTGVTLQRYTNYNHDDLVLTINGTNDQLTIHNYFYNSASTSAVVETIQFANGTVWDLATVKINVLAGSSGNDTIAGYASADRLAGYDGNDKIDGLAGDDTLSGGNGADTLSGGDGNDTVNGEGGADTLLGDDGNDILFGGDGDDLVGGHDGADRLDGGAGNDSLNGGDGADTYLFGKGGGHDTIDNRDGDVQGTNADKVLLGAGIAATGVTLARERSDLILKIEGTSDRLTIKNYFDGDGKTGAAVETIQFADGIAWDVATVKAKVLAATADNDMIRGGAGAERLSGLAGRDEILGGAGNDTLSGGDGIDRLYGESGNDTVNGDAGADWLYGDDGDDTVSGGSGNDWLYGGNGNDRLYGGAGGEWLNGGDGADWLDGGADDDALDGGRGADTYVFGKGSGKDGIFNSGFDDNTSTPDTILLGKGIATGDVTLANADGHLVLTIKGAADRLTVYSYFTTFTDIAGTIGAIEFADGTRWNQETIKAKVALPPTPASPTLSGTSANDILKGLAGDDTLYGKEGNDRLDGGAGNDVLDGGAGSDTYLFGLGSGEDTIHGHDAAAGKLDVVQLGAGVSAANLVATRSGADLVLTIKGAYDALWIKDYFVGDGAGGYQVEQIRFADGTAWNVAAIKSKVLVATAEDDGRLGYATADVLSGLAGDDTLLGLGGNDTLDGGAGDDRLLGGEGDDLLKGGTHDDELRGETGNDRLLGQDGNDDLDGDAGDDILDGGAGNDELDGGTGNDTYLFGIGSGKDTLRSDDDDGELETIQLGAGVNAAKLVFRASYSDLVLGIVGTSDELRIEGYFSGIAGDRRIDQIKFADGTVWDVAAIHRKVMAGSAEDDTLYGDATANVIAGLAGDDSINGFDGDDSLDAGTGNDALYGGNGNDSLKGGLHDDKLEGGSGNDVLMGQDGKDWLFGGDGADTLDGGMGNDELMGGAGNDVYLFGLGSGKDRIGAYQIGAADVDVVQLGAGVSTANLIVTRDEHNYLVLNIEGTSDVLQVFDYFSDNAPGHEQVKQIRFADGTAWDVAAINAKILAATAGNDVRHGYTTNDVLAGLAGNDTLYGGAGDDNLDGGTGADRLYGEKGNDVFIVDNTGDVVTESANQGTDRVHSSVSYTLGLNVENLTLTGTVAINGTGNVVANKIIGNGASNRITGGRGADVLTGGAGNDIFDVNASAETGITAATRDVISDFVRGQDKIDLMTIDANSLTTANDVFTGFVGSTSAFTKAGQLKFANGVLYGNTDADSEAEFSIQLTGITTLGTADILL